MEPKIFEYLKKTLRVLMPTLMCVEDTGLLLHNETGCSISLTIAEEHGVNGLIRTIGNTLINNELDEDMIFKNLTINEYRVIVIFFDIKDEETSEEG